MLSVTMNSHTLKLNKINHLTGNLQEPKERGFCFRTTQMPNSAPGATTKDCFALAVIQKSANPENKTTITTNTHRIQYIYLYIYHKDQAEPIG